MSDIASTAAPSLRHKKTVVAMGRHRRAVASRALAAIGAGYALASATAAGVGLVLVRFGTSAVDAVLWATMLAFIAQATAALWAFGCANAWRAWFGIALPAALLGALAWGLRGAAA